MTTNQSRTHKDLIVWQAAIGLATDIYRIAQGLPRHELFGLASQLRRAAVSIPSNIAEGAARRTTKEFLSFLYIARGSASELDTQLRLAEDLGYFSAEELSSVRSTTEDVARMLSAVIAALHRRLRSSSQRSPVSDH